MNPLERTILRQLFGDRQFAEKVEPYLKESYFHSGEAAILFRLYDAFFQKFNTVPSFAAVRIGLDSTPTLSENEAKSAAVMLSAVEGEKLLDDSQTPWLLEQTEEWCQDRAVYCALQESIKVMDDPKVSRHVIPELMKDALAVSFDSHVGHDYFADAAARYEFYHKPDARLPFDLDTFNKLTGGGVPRKTLNVVLAGTNVGKSLALCHFAAAYLRTNHNVLYITCEMAEERIAHRIDGNMMDIPMDDVECLPETDYARKMAWLRQSSTGKLVVKEYPTGIAHVGMFRALLQELRLKKNFRPDVIMIDYLTICSSMRVKLSGAVNSFSFYKFIAEEFRGLGVEENVPVWTAGQFNRSGFASSDPGLEDIGESFGIPQTADFAVALVQTEELEKLGQVSLIELKNRYKRKRKYLQHMLGMDTDRMKLYELSAQQLAHALTLPATNQLSPAPTASAGGQGAFSQRRKPPLQRLRKENGNKNA